MPPPPPPPAVSVSLSQATATVQAGATAQFTAMVSNDTANQGVTWKVSCSVASCGSVLPNATASGAATTYTAPSSAGSSDLQVTLTATSVADTTKTASAAISVTPSLIAVGTAPSAIAVDSTNNKIYVTDFGTTPTTVPITGCSNSGADIRVIDGATQATTSVGVFFFFTEMNPFAATVNPASHSLYVLTHQYSSGFGRTCGLFGNPLETFDTTSLQQSANLFDFGGAGIAVNPNNGNVYVTRNGGIGGAGTVVVMTVNIGTNQSPTVLATIPVGTNPAGVAVDTATNKVYVANSGSNDVSVIDGSTNAVVTKIADPKAVHPIAIAVNPATNLIYVANSQSNNMTVIDGATGSVTATVPVGTSPSGVAVDPQTNFIYVANAGNSQTGDPGDVTVINGATNTTTTVSDPKAINPVAVAANPATNKIYVANRGSNNVTVIDGAH